MAEALNYNTAQIIADISHGNAHQNLLRRMSRKLQVPWKGSADAYIGTAVLTRCMWHSADDMWDGTKERLYEAEAVHQPH